MATKVFTRLVHKIKPRNTQHPLQRYLYHTTTAPESSTLEHPPPHSHATVVLVSGGLESTALLSYWTHWSHATEMIPLFVNYGQRNALKEQESARAVCQHLNVASPEILNLESLSGLYSGMQRGEEKHNQASFRNLMLLTLGASAAVEIRAAHVALAMSKGHEPRSEDAAISFLRHAESLFHALEPPISLLTPLLHLTTPQVVQLGEQANAPWELTWSCTESGEEHCGVCGGCKAREQALASV